ncbi:MULTISPECIES: iron ABC transporter permease [Aquitalea]|uniref:FecCD family ABC transporter permease n=1 Tax=Aquitalea TaxID=407217 RepID=UPI00135A35DE|nr:MULTISPECIES: iron ABC transporter permease [Aquitalea]
MSQTPTPSLAATPPRSYASVQWRKAAGLLCALLLIAGSLLLDFTIGPAGLSLAQLAAALQRQGDAMHVLVVWDIRLPMALLAVTVGMALGLAGAELQTVLGNPLASPFTLGLSAAAALGAALGMLLQDHLPAYGGSWLVPTAAFAFAMSVALLLDLTGRLARLSSTGIIMFGIACDFSCHALLSLVQFAATTESLQNIVFWTMGSLSHASWQAVGLLTLTLLLSLPWALTDSWRLTALRMGEERASSFGVNVAALRLRALFRVSLLAGTAVAMAGTIGFIGLVAPHIARSLFGEDHRFFLPASMLVGGIILSCSSLVSRLLLPGIIIPVGIVTALVGIPFFMVIVCRNGRSN